METTKILRLEAADGLGIFRSRDNNRNIRDFQLYMLDCNDDLTNVHEELPPPGNDLLIGDKFLPGYHYCAYKSVEQFQEWVKPEWCKELIDNGIKVLLLEVINPIVGMHQVAYYKDAVINTEDITDLFR